MGIGYDSSLWTLQQVPTLSTRFRVVLLDNRDAGRSCRADHPYTIADMATLATMTVRGSDDQRPT
jgi:pimeloyl-ACP methyl ester carboxylesterase